MIKDLLEVEVELENVVLKDPKVLREWLVKWDLLKGEVKLEHVVKKVTKEGTRGIGQQGPIGPRGSTGPRGVQGVKVLRGAAPLVQLVYKANVDRKETMVLKVLLGKKVFVVNEENVVNEVKMAFKVILQMF